VPERPFFLSVVYPHSTEALRDAEQQLRDSSSMPSILVTTTDEETTLDKYLQLSKNLGMNRPPKHIGVGRELEIYATRILLTQVALIEASDQSQAAISEYPEGIWEVSGISFLDGIRHDATAILAGAGKTMSGAVILAQTGAPRSQTYDS
jgi:hypothetical protein